MAYGFALFGGRKNYTASRKNSDASNLNYMARNLNLVARSFYDIRHRFHRIIYYLKNKQLRLSDFLFAKKTAEHCFRNIPP